jgi:hypothetical protein
MEDLVLGVRPARGRAGLNVARLIGLLPGCPTPSRP